MSTNPIVWQPPNNFSLTNWVEFVTINTLGVGTPRNQFDMVKFKTGVVVRIVAAGFGIRASQYVPYKTPVIGEDIEKELINWDSQITPKTTYIFIKNGLTVSNKQLVALYNQNGVNDWEMIMPSRGITF